MASLSDCQRSSLAELRAAGDAGITPDRRRKRESGEFRELVRLGLAREDGCRFFCVPSPALGAELIWLPNTIVQGTKVGELSPLWHLRTRNDIEALKLFVDLYQAQKLGSDGGISRAVLRGNYDRKRLGQRGRHLIWGFTPKDATASLVDGVTQKHWSRQWGAGKDNPIWDSTNILTSLGLLYCVPHLVENSTRDCEIVHAYGTNADAEAMERELGQVAHKAGEHMLGEELGKKHLLNGIRHFAPVFDSYPDVQKVGVYRLRYRPKTYMTAEWMQRLGYDHQTRVPAYESLAGRKKMENAVA